MRAPLALALSTVLCAASYAPTAHAAGEGLAASPACLYDFKRDFSVYKATERLIAARNMFLANGSKPLSGADLTTAKGHLHTAWSHLEQVMNFGLFAFKPCFTCNSDAKIGTAGPTGWPLGMPWTFQNIADQVALVETSVQGSPTPKKYGVIADALKDNWATWISSADYCGHYTTTVKIVQLLDKWEYGKVGGTVIATNFELSNEKDPRGLKIKGYSNPNEATWWLVNDEIVLVDKDGRLTARLRRGSDDYWEGPYYAKIGARVAHYLKRAKSGVGGGGGGGGGGSGGGGGPDPDDGGCLFGQC
jgi:hypothetical protein